MMRKTLILSMGIHALLLLLVCFKFPKPSQAGIEKPLSIEVEVIPAKSQKAKEKTGGKRSGAKKGSRLSKLSILVPRVWDQGALAVQQGTKDLPLPEGDWGSQAASFRQMTFYLSFQRLHDKIDPNLFYPGILAYYGHQGTVNGRMKMSGRGCGDGWISLKGNAYLRIYVKQLFRLVCKPEFLKGVLGAEEHTVDFSFAFVLRDEATKLLLEGDRQFVHGNVLGFYRSIPKSKLEWHLGPFRGLLGVPLVNIDFMWVYEQWTKGIDHKDLLDKYREQGP
jgi:hypothetical protein